MSENVVRELTEREKAVLGKHAAEVEDAKRKLVHAQEVLQDLCNLIAEEGQVVNLQRGCIEEGSGQEPE